MIETLLKNFKKLSLELGLVRKLKKNIFFELKKLTEGHNKVKTLEFAFKKN